MTSSALVEESSGAPDATCRRWWKRCSLFSMTSRKESGDSSLLYRYTIPILIEGAVVNHCSGTNRCADSSYVALDDFN
eukprot:COSAG01_NODE_158_length_23708_cov_7.921979_3_plen_78_part_00